jgi:hypothetical protein
VLGRPLICLWRGASALPWVPVCFLAWRLHTLSRLRSDPTRRLQILKADCFVMGMRALCHLQKTGRRDCLLICPVSGEFCTPRSHWYASWPVGSASNELGAGLDTLVVSPTRGNSPTPGFRTHVATDVTSLHVEEIYEMCPASCGSSIALSPA